MKITFICNSLRNNGGLEKWHIFVGNLLSSSNEVKVIGIDMGGQKRITEEEMRKMIKFDYNEVREDEFEKYMDVLFYSDIFYVTIGDRNILDRVLLYCRGKKIFGAHHSEYVYYSKEDGIDWGKDRFSLKATKDKLWIRRLLEILPKFDGVHILNDSLSYWSKYNSYVFLLPNTVPNIEAFGSVKKNDNFTVLFYGRHEKYKGTETIEYIALRLDERVRLIIAGSGTESNHLSIHVKSNIEFLGHIEESKLYTLIQRSHLVLFPSYMENSSMIPLESMRMGTPVLGRDTNFNQWTRGLPMCRLAFTDKEFLDTISVYENEWKTNKELYMQECEKLKKIPMSEDEYKEKFEGFLRNVVKLLPTHSTSK